MMCIDALEYHAGIIKLQEKNWRKKYWNDKISKTYYEVRNQDIVEFT